MADGSKKYFWLKLKRDFFKQHEIRVIESMPNGKDYILFYLKLLCESVSHEGHLRFSDQIPYNDTMLAAITGTNVDIVRTAVKVFADLNMMELLDDGTLFMTEVEQMIGSETEWAEKKRLYREKLSLGQIEDKSRTKKDNVRQENRDKSLENREKSIKESNRGVQRGTAKRSQTPTPDPFDVESDSLREALKDFEKMRKELRAPLTERAKKRILTKLSSIASDDPGKIASIEQSIVNCWKDVYEVHEDAKTYSFSTKKQRKSEIIDDFDYEAAYEEDKRKGLL